MLDEMLLLLSHMTEIFSEILHFGEKAARVFFPRPTEIYQKE
jgi:hypothetical protein